MELLSVSRFGRLLLSASSSEYVILRDANIAWTGRDGIESRVWYLPAMLRLGMKPDLAAHREAIKEAITWLKTAPIPTTPDRDPDVPLREYQRDGCGFLQIRKGAILADDVGLGKSIMSGNSLRHFLEEGNAGIIVSTLGTKLQWKDEIEDKIMARFPPRIYVVEGPRKRRLGAYRAWAAENENPVLLLHHDPLRRDVIAIRDAIIKQRARRKVMMILDEASIIRNSGTKIWQAAMMLAPLLEKRFALTATPLENGLEDLWALAHWVAPKYLGPCDNYNDRHIVRRLIERSRGPAFWKVIKYTHLDEVRLAIRPLYLRRTAKEVGLQLPKIIPIVRELPMAPDQRKLYDKYKSDMLAKRVPAVASIQYLRQICNSPASIGQPGGSPKLDDLELMINEWPHEKIVVFTQYAKFAYIIAARIASHNPLIIAGNVTEEKRDHAKRMFMQNPRYRVLIMTSAGERGLNLQIGSVLINMDLPWNPAAWRQRLGRLYRIGNEHASIRAVSLVMQDSIESRVLKALGGKQGLFDSIIMAKGEDEVRDTMKITVAKAMALA